MATPTRAEIDAVFKHLANGFDELSDVSAVDATNLIGIEDSAAQALEGDFMPAALSAWRRNLRGNVSRALSPAALRSVFDPIAREYGKLYNFPETDPITLWRRIYREWADTGTPVTIKRRNPTLGSVSAGGSNVGGGTLHRISTDADGYVIEEVYPAAKKATCIRDRYSGATKWNEVFEMRSGDEEWDYLARSGSGDTAEITAINSETSQEFISNPSFTNVTGSGSSITAIADWTVGSSIANFAHDTSTTYADDEGEATAGAIEFEDNDSLTQKFSVREPSFSDDEDLEAPIFVQLEVYRKDSADGVFTLDFGGSQEQVADITSLNNAAWNTHKLTLGTKNWYRNIKEDDADLKLTLGSRTTGSILVDCIKIGRCTWFDGHWWALVNDTTPFLRNDEFTWTDSISTESVLQKLLCWAYPRLSIYMPSSATPVISDP